MEDAAFISNLVSVLIDQPDRELRDIEDDDNFELMTFPDIMLPRDRAFSWDVSLENDVSGELMAQQALDAYAKETADPKAPTGNKRTMIPVFVKPENHVNLLNNYQPSNNSSKDSKCSITSGGETVTVKVEGLNHSVGIAANHTISYPDGSDDLFDQVDHILEPFLQDSVNQQFNHGSSQNSSSVLPGVDGNPTNIVTQNSLSQQHSSITSPYMTTTTSTKDRSMGSSLSINGHLVKPKVTIKLESKPISSSKGPDIKKTNEILKGFDHSTSIYLKHDFDSNAAANNNNSTKRSLSTTSGTGSSSSSSGNNHSNNNLSNTLVIPTMTSDIKRSPHMNLSMLQQQQQQSLGLNNNNTSMISNTNSSNLNGLPSLSSSNTGLNSLASTLNGNNTSNSGLSANSLLGSNNVNGGGLNGMNNNNGNNNNSLSIQSIHKVTSTGSMNNSNGLSTEYAGYNNPSSSLGSSTSGKLTSPYLVSTSSNSAAGGVGGNTMGTNGNLVGNVNVNSKDADMMARNIMLSNAYNYADMLSMQQSSGNTGMMSNAGGALGLNATLGSGISSPNMVHHHHLQQQQQQLHQHRYSPNLGMEMSPYMMNSNMSMNMTIPGGGGGLERRVGAYTIEERRIKIEKFRERKRQRIWRKQIKYDCRKRLADTRPRVKGRFVSRKNLGSNNSLDAQDGQMSPDGKDYHDAAMELGEGSDDDNSTGGLPQHQQHQHHHQSNLHHHQSGLNVNIHGSNMAMNGLNNMSNMHNLNGTSMNNMSGMSGLSGSGMSMNGLNSMNVSGIGGIGTGSVLSGGTSGLNSMMSGNLSHGSSHHTSHNHHALNQHHLHQHQHHQNHQHTHHLHSNNTHGLNLHHQQQQHHQSQQQQSILSSSADMILEFPPELPSMVSMGTLGPSAAATTTNTGSLQSPSSAALGAVPSSATSSMVGNSLPNALNS